MIIFIMQKKYFIYAFLSMALLGAFLAVIFYNWKKSDKNYEANQDVIVSSKDPVAVDENAQLDNIDLKVENVSADEQAIQQQADKAGSFSFAIFGDTQRFSPNNINGGFQKSSKFVQDKNVDFVMTVGDLLSSCSDGCAQKFQAWKAVLGPLAAKTYEVMGNHDRTGKQKADQAWQESFNLPTNGPEGYKELVYSFDFANTHFVVLNSEKPKENVINEVQRTWLENDLKNNKKEQTFVFFHEPAYPVSSKIDESLDAEKKDRDALWAIFSKYKVKAVFNGHEHINSRRNVGGIQQFIFGNTDSFDHDLPKPGIADYSYKGQNFGIVSVNGSKIGVQVFSVDGVLLDTFNF
jgi:predicted phosphodiesterase